MATYIPHRRTEQGMEQVKIPVSSIAEDNTLLTKEKDLIGAINELNSKINGIVGTWVFNNTLELLEGENLYELNFTSNGTNYKAIGISSTYIFYFKNLQDYAYDSVYSSKFGWNNELYKYVSILEEPTVPFIADWVKANAKKYEPVGAEKIGYINTTIVQDVAIATDGIEIGSALYITDSQGIDIASGLIDSRVPVVAGDNVTFSYDEENNAIAINATGGSNAGTSESTLLNITVSTDYPTTMSAIITAIEEAGGNVAQANFVSLTGYVSGFVSMKFQHYGGNTYKVECVDINNVTKIYNPETDNVIDATTTLIKSFLSYKVNNGLPEYTEENEGQFVSIVGGVAKWIELPVAEDIVIDIAEEITFNE